MKIREMLYKACKYTLNPDYRFQINCNMGKYDSMDDEEFLKREFKAVMGKELDFQNPQTFNEKLQWLKLNDRRPEYTMMVDKYLVREYIAQIIGERYLIPLLGVWDDPDEIDFDKLPNQFVLKCNHNSGLGMCICKDKSKLNIGQVRQALQRGIKENYYLKHREWPYKDVPRKIICEQYMDDGTGNGLRDYKFFCFDGEPRFLYVSEGMDRHETAKVSFVTKEWKPTPFRRIDYSAFTELPEKPDMLDQMLDIAAILAQNHPFLRVDLYNIGERIYFGELTLYHCAGFMKFVPEEWDAIVGHWIVLPEKK